ncbi:MAG: helix-turn-helix domain-containing protein [Deltaproteobacteria bacterium]|nr:helix-turn-helix domain-containing protein [Deltaproteobacteria bacterium]
MPDPAKAGRRSGPRGPLKQRNAAFDGLGKALRWLREQRLMKQYQAAEAAGITKAMLSAYETGKQRPTIDTLERLLYGLGVGLSELAEVIPMMRAPLPADKQASRHGQGGGPTPIGPPFLSPSALPSTLDLRKELGGNVDAEEEEAIHTMVLSYIRWLRVIRRRTL